MALTPQYPPLKPLCFLPNPRPPTPRRKIRGRSHDTGMTFIPERVHSIPIYFSVSVYMIPRRNFVLAQLIPE